MSALQTGQVTAPESEIVELTRLAREGEPFPERFTFRDGTSDYVVRSDGRGERVTRDGRRRRFRIEVEKDNRIERLYFLPCQGDLLLVYEMTDGETGIGAVTRLSGDSLRRKWKASVLGFNVGVGLREGDDLYLTAIGFVGKLKLSDGRYAWKHDGLYQRYKAFNDFEVPRIEGDNVVFTESSIAVYHRTPYVIRVNKRGGQISVDIGTPH